MAVINEFGMPFNDVGGDRTYSSADWRTYFDGMIISGVLGSIGNELAVTQQTVANKTVKIDTGAVLIKGAIRQIDTAESLNIADNTSGNPRIDRIVARLNNTDRKVEFTVKQGTPGASAPALTQTSTIYEIPLAKIAVANGFSTITTGNITDDRIYMTYRDRVVNGRMAALEDIITALLPQITPIGTVIWYAQSTAPTNYKVCDGSLLNRTTYASLFAVIGTTFGAGDGSTTFALPDLRAAFIRGIDSGKGINTGRAFGSAEASTKWRQNSGSHDADIFAGQIDSTTDTDYGVRPYNVALLPCIKYI